ncbi:MAG TPA: retropepsin-like aspartic protease [Candidatus Acidoferrales bacterium]|nr:retropepsin-like aspartic protease [Candidatus Acidoferrales bacterium]
MRFRFLAAAIALAGLLIPFGPAQADDAAALLAKHRAYAGWQFGDGTFRSWQISGSSVRANGTVESRWSTLQTGAIFRSAAKYGQWGYTGNVFWRSDENGFVHPDYSKAQAYQVSWTALFAEATTELDGTLRANETVDGATLPVVRVTPPHGDAIDLAVDPASGAYRRAVIDPGGAYETTVDILGYADVLPGKKMIVRYREDGSANVRELKIEPNVAVAADEFHPPAATATWTFANANPFAISVKPHAIFLDATVNGVKGRFILDTGADGIFLGRSFAERAHMRTIGRSETYGMTGGESISIERADSVAIGGNTLSNVIVSSGDLFAEEDDEYVDGLIGQPLFGGAVVTLNTGAQTMSIADPASATVSDSAGYKAVVDLNSGQPVVPVTIDGRVDANALLDMGNGGTVIMSENLVTKHSIPIMAREDSASFDDAGARAEYAQSHLILRGVSGAEEEVRCSTVSSIALGPIVYQNTFACVSKSMDGDNVVMGYGFMKSFDYVFDYPSGVMYLKPHQQ